MNQMELSLKILIKDLPSYLTCKLLFDLLFKRMKPIAKRVEEWRVRPTAINDTVTKL
jgi:hypothetical protein